MGLIDSGCVQVKPGPKWLPPFGKGFSNGKEPAWNVEDLSLIPSVGRSTGEGHGNPLQYSCLENSMDRGAWWLQFMGSQRVGHD